MRGGDIRQGSHAVNASDRLLHTAGFTRGRERIRHSSASPSSRSGVTKIRDRAAGVNPNSLVNFVMVSTHWLTTPSSGLCITYPLFVLYKIPILVSFSCA